MVEVAALTGFYTVLVNCPKQSTRQSILGKARLAVDFTENNTLSYCVKYLHLKP